MSNINVKCSRCGKRHGLESYNTRIEGPVIRIFCPFCRNKTVKNLSKFVEDQMPSIRDAVGRFESCARMAEFARKMEKELD